VSVKLPDRQFGGSSLYFLLHRLAAAFFAISFRRLALMPSARACPPFRPSATAAGSFPSFGGVETDLTKRIEQLEKAAPK
jgi:hypothetical protein